MAPKSVKLYYFDSTGRGEYARLALSVAGVPYEDIRIKHEDWPSQKPKFPFGQVPVLEVDGVMIPQLRAILYYVAEIGGLLPADVQERALVDSVLEHHEDIFQKVMPWVKASNEEKPAIAEKLLREDLPYQLGLLDRYLSAHGASKLIGAELGIADLAVFILFHGLVTGLLPFCSGPVPELKAKCPTLASITRVVSEDPRVQKYLAKMQATKAV